MRSAARHARGGDGAQRSTPTPSSWPRPWRTTRRPAAPAAQKIEKGGPMTIALERTRRHPGGRSARDGAVPRDPVLVGFAAQTGDPTAAARRKLDAKRVDLIVANDVTAPGAGFDVETNQVVARHARGRRSPPAHVQDCRRGGRHRSRRAAPGRVAGALGVAMSRQEIAAHLQFLRELGVTGVSRDPAWREREGDPAPSPRRRPAAVAVQSGARAIDPVAEGSLTPLATLDALRAHIGPPARAASSASRAAARSSSASAIRTRS